MSKSHWVRWLSLGAAGLTLFQFGSCNLENPLWLAVAGVGGWFAFTQLQQ